MNELLLFATRLARETGAIVQGWQRRGITIETKSSTIDLVTEADRAADAQIVRAIRHHWPTHDLLTEEGGAEQRGSRWRWIVDPLDGTTNFAQAIPHYSISIALEKAGELQLGVVYDPVRDELFSALRGDGAWLDAPWGRVPLRVSRATALENAVVATGFPYDKATSERNNVAEFSRVVRRLRGIRRMGSAALDLAYVAAGRLDGYWEYALSPWDMAAGALLVREAGGVVHSVDGSAWSLQSPSILAANPAFAPTLRQALLGNG